MSNVLLTYIKHHMKQKTNIGLQACNLLICAPLVADLRLYAIALFAYAQDQVWKR